MKSSSNCVYLGFENDCRLSSVPLVLQLTTSSVAICRWTGDGPSSDVGPVVPQCSWGSPESVLVRSRILLVRFFMGAPRTPRAPGACGEPINCILSGPIPRSFTYTKYFKNKHDKIPSDSSKIYAVVVVIIVRSWAKK